ncbi:MAG: transglutaminase family protein [Syntrophales bacterium]
MNQENAEDIGIYLRPTEFLDSDSRIVIEFARKAAAGAVSPVEKAVRLYYAVRDGIQYDPYRVDLTPNGLKASSIISRGFGYCVAKAVVLAAAGRAQGVPVRLRFADVRNHLSTQRLRDLMKTDIFVYHGYTEFFLEGKWVKATPTFNLSLCERFKVRPLEFDGRNDSIFHEYNETGEKHLEYIRDHGSFPDLPLDLIVSSFRLHYPALVKSEEMFTEGSFEREATKEKGG